MNMQNFVHLRLHTEFSVNDSILRIADIVKTAKSDQMMALGITDLHNMFGMVKFYQECRNHGIKPILGAEVNVVANGRNNPNIINDTNIHTNINTSTNINAINNENNSENQYKIILLIKNSAGLRELSELIAKSYIHNKILDRPFIAEEWLLDPQTPFTGLIALSGGVYGDIGQLILKSINNSSSEAIDKAKRWSLAFPDSYYLELQRVVPPHANDLIDNTISIAHALNLPVVATHPIQFIKPSDYVAHELRICIASGERLDDESRKSQFGQDQYFLTQAAMIEQFSDIPSAIANTVEITKRCNLEITLGEYFLPNFTIPDGVTLEDYLANLATDGLNKRLCDMSQDNQDNDNSHIHNDTHNDMHGDTPHTPHHEIYHDRLAVEIKTIIQMGFAGYFLIVADFINWAKSNNVPVGPGRGSGAGSIVAFALNITDIDPIRYGLLFERFLNPERVSMPDFDIDFCQDKRELVIEYVKNKYGVDSVAQIATFGTMSSKAVIKDVGRALGLPYGLCDAISKLILNTPAKSFSLLEAYDKFPDLAEKIKDGDEDVKRLWDLSLQLEDLTRSVGKHAAGVLIAPTRLTDFCPLYVADGMQTSQLDKDDVEAVGLVKFDFLGLRNLTIIQESIENIKSLYNIDIKLSQYDFSDVAVYKLLQDGNTSAIFQLESPGMKRVLTKLAPDRFEDIIALLALYRPGPLGSGMVDDFIRRKKGIDTPNYFHDDLKTCLESTYGVIVYQEQVMQISQIIGGYTLGGADLLRRAMGKKKAEEMAAHKETFVSGAKSRGYAVDLAENLFDLMAKFAEYGFNKSHSAAYAVISYHTAFLKAHYLTCFMAATLSSELDKTDKLYEFYQDCVDNNIVITPPDINRSKYRFCAIDDKTICYALGAIKGVGRNVVELIVKEREEHGLFTGFVDFCLRVDKKAINKKTLESLVKAGAFDQFELNQVESSRASLFGNIAKILDSINEIHQRRNTNQASLFDELFGDDDGAEDNFVLNQLNHPTINLVQYAPWSLKEQLHMEKQALGYYFSASLFDEYKEIVRKLGIEPLSKYSLDNEEIAELINSGNNSNGRNREKHKVVVCGIINNIGAKPLKKGGKITFVNLEDASATLEFVVFDTEAEAYKSLLKIDEFVFVEGELMYDSFREQVKITGKRIYTLDEMLQNHIKSITLHMNHSDNVAGIIDKIYHAVSDSGVAKLNINYANQVAKCKVEMPDTHKFVVNYANISALNSLLDKHSWAINSI
jgi:DNA polymerase-3 subunit alpha